MSVPALRFKEFTSNLENAKLGEMCTFTQGVQIPSSEQVTLKQDGFIRYLYIRDFFSNDFPCFVRDAYPEKIIKTDEIMMVNTGNTTGMAYMGATGVLSNNSFKIGFDHSVLNNKYLFNFLTSEKTQQNIRNFFNAGGQPHLGHKNIAQIDFTFPSLTEQTKISNFLTAVDEKISLLTQKLDLLTQYKKGVMQQIFSQELRFKDDNGKDFPEWEEKLVGEVFKDFKGTGLSKDKIGEVGKNKCILYGHLFTRYSEVITKINSRTDFEEGLLSEANDILMPSSTTTKGVDLAKASSLNQSGVLLGGDIIVLRLKEKGNSNFFAYLLTHAKSKEIAEITQGITIIHLYFSQLKNILLNYPCEKEQTKIANFLTAIDDKITATQTQLQAVKQYKQGLLQQMFV